MAPTNLNDIEKVVDDLDPAAVIVRDAVHFRRIIAAQEGVSRADRELPDAVREAREGGLLVEYRDGAGCDKASGSEALRTLTRRSCRITRLSPLRHSAHLDAPSEDRGSVRSCRCARVPRRPVSRVTR